MKNNASKLEKFRIETIEKRKEEINLELSFIDALISEICVEDYSIAELLTFLREFSDWLTNELKRIEKTLQQKEC